MSSKTQSQIDAARAKNKKSQAEILAARGVKAVSGGSKVAARLQRRIQRLVERGGIHIGVLKNLPIAQLVADLTKADIKKAEEDFEQAMDARFEPPKKKRRRRNKKKAKV